MVVFFDKSSFNLMKSHIARSNGTIIRIQRNRKKKQVRYQSRYTSGIEIEIFRFETQKYTEKKNNRSKNIIVKMQLTVEQCLGLQLNWVWFGEKLF